MEKLPSASRDLVDAIYTRGIDAATLAQQEGRAVQTIYNKLNFIRRSLAECVQRRITETTS
ncbi:hypothetical protein [Verrucomicrobium spinosum]|nr:hypothetical protein [Verrucomicrobium spinosum]